MEITASYDDPDEDDDNADVTLTVTLTADDAGLLVDDTDTADVDESMKTIGSLTWSDSKAAAQTLVLGQSIAYHESSAKGGGVRHSVTATLLDQYGDPVSGAPINFWSDANNGNRENDDGDAAVQAPADDASDEVIAEFLARDLYMDDDGLGGAKGSTAMGSVQTCSRPDTDDASKCDSAADSDWDGDDNFRSTVKTNRAGVAKQAYRRDADTAQHETISALYAVGKRDGALTEPNEETDDNADGTVVGERDGALTVRNLENDDLRGDDDPTTMATDDMSHYWATAVEDEGDGMILVGDTDANIIVFDSDDQDATITPMLAKYDSNDQFNHGPDVTSGGVKMDVFEAGLKAKATKGGPIDIDLASDPEPGVNVFGNEHEDAEVPEAPNCHD